MCSLLTIAQGVFRRCPHASVDRCFPICGHWPQTSLWNKEDLKMVNCGHELAVSDQCCSCEKLTVNKNQPFKVNAVCILTCWFNSLKTFSGQNVIKRFPRLGVMATLYAEDRAILLGHVLPHLTICHNPACLI